MEQALETLNKRFRYTADGVVDRWTFLSDRNGWRGDCEDYALTLSWLVSGSVWKFIWNLITFQHLFWFVVLPNRTTHMIVKIDGSYYDNIQQRAFSSAELDKFGYQLVFPMIWPLIAIKLILSYTIFLPFKR